MLFIVFAAAAGVVVVVVIVVGGSGGGSGGSVGSGGGCGGGGGGHLLRPYIILSWATVTIMSNIILSTNFQFSIAWKLVAFPTAAAIGLGHLLRNLVLQRLRKKAEYLQKLEDVFAAIDETGMMDEG